MRSSGRRRQARQAEGTRAPQAASEHALSAGCSGTAHADSSPAVGTAAEPSASCSDQGPAQGAGAGLQRPRQAEAKLGAAVSRRARMAAEAVPLSKEEAAQQVWRLHQLLEVPLGCMQTMLLLVPLCVSPSLASEIGPCLGN